jgi:hypothetical protein
LNNSTQNIVLAEILSYHFKVLIILGACSLLDFLDPNRAPKDTVLEFSLLSCYFSYLDRTFNSIKILLFRMFFLYFNILLGYFFKENL